jgi:superfamily I DNA/RNA helicase
MEWIKFLSTQLGEAPPEITTFNSWASRAIRGLGYASSLEFDDAAGKLLELAKGTGDLPPSFRAHHVLVDEAQDLPADALKVIKMSAITSFTVAADRAQSIYNNGFTWKSIGINVRGSRVRSLERSMRSTKQIALLATDLARNDRSLEKEDLISDFGGLRDGPIPEIFFCRSYSAGDQAVRNTISLARAENPSGTIAILHANRRIAYAIAKAFGGRFLDPQKPDMVTPGVVVGTIHSTKGLEFDTVIVKDVNEGVLPAGARADDEANVLGGDMARRVLYVACTRAKRRLVVIVGSRPSPLINELDDTHYRRVDV